MLFGAVFDYEIAATNCVTSFPFPFRKLRNTLFYSKCLSDRFDHKWLMKYGVTFNHTTVVEHLSTNHESEYIYDFLGALVVSDFVNELNFAKPTLISFLPYFTL